MAIEKTIVLKADTTQASKGIEKLDKDVKGVESSSKGAKIGLSNMTGAVKGLGLAFKAMGIGLVVSAFVSLKEALGQNQIIMDGVNITTAIIGDIFQKLVNTIMSVVKGLGLLGKSVSKVLKGEFKEAGDIAKQSFNGVKDAIVGNNKSFKDFINNAKEASKETVKFAKDLVRLQNEVKLAEANQRQLQLTYQKDAELQRQLRDDISLTFEERIKANEELGRILDEQFAEEQALANKKVELAELELSRNKNNIDLQVALINAKTELADLDERITGQRSEQLTNLKALEKEEADLVQSNIDLKKKESEQILQLAKKTAEEEENIRKQKLETLKQMEISGAQSILSALNQLAGEGTALAKATALTQILINSAQAVSGAIKAGAGVPFPGNLGAIATGVGAVLSGIASAKNIFAKADSSEAGSIDTQASISQGQVQSLGSLVPNISAIETPDLGNEPIQAFVVENDISNSQALQEQLQIQATL